VGRDRALRDRELLVAGVILPAQERHPAAPTQPGDDVAKCCLGVGEEHHAETADHHIVGVLPQRIYLGVASLEPDIGHTFLGGELPRDIQHRTGHVDTQRASIPGCSRRRDSRLAAAAADVEHALIRRDERRVEQAGGQRLVAPAMPLAVGNPVTAGRAVPPLRLRLVHNAARFSHRLRPLSRFMRNKRPTADCGPPRVSRSVCAGCRPSLSRTAAAA